MQSVFSTMHAANFDIHTCVHLCYDILVVQEPIFEICPN